MVITVIRFNKITKGELFFMEKQKVGLGQRIDKFFGITKSGSTFKTEIIAGITTFMSMVYILMVNAGLFQIGGLDFGGMYIATAIGAIAGTLLIALLAKMPLAQASGMGINAFLVFVLMGETGLSFANCMMLTLLEGLVFVILTVTGLRKKIFEAIPASVRKAIGVGIGLFIAFIGMQQAGLVLQDDPGGTIVEFVSFNVLGGKQFVAWDSGSNAVVGMLPAIIALVGVILIAILSKKNVKGAILWGLLGSAVVYYAILGILALAGVNGANAVLSQVSFSNPFDAFGSWGKQNVGAVFTDGFNFVGIEGGTGGLVLIIITTTLSLCMIDMFDTIGTLYGACSKGGLLDENGVPLNMNKCLLADAIATCVGAVAGTSTVTTFVESSAGVAAGGKTGFTALVTGICFIFAMFLSPIAQLIPRSATAAALIWVGVLMMSGVKDIDWTDPLEAVVAFVTLLVMCLGYSISKGIGWGIIFYVLVSILAGKGKEIKISTWVIAGVYLATFLLS